MAKKDCTIALLFSLTLTSLSFGESSLLEIVQDSLAHYRTLDEVSIRETNRLANTSEIISNSISETSGRLWWIETVVSPETGNEYKVAGFRNEEFACGLSSSTGQWALAGLHARGDSIYDTISFNNHNFYCAFLYVGPDRIDSLLKSEKIKVSKTKDFGDSMTEFWLEPVTGEFDWAYEERSVLVDKVTNLIQGYRYVSKSGISDQNVIDEWTQFAGKAYPSVISSISGKSSDMSTIVTTISYEPLDEFTRERCSLEYYGLGKPELNFKQSSSIGWWIASGVFGIVSLIGFILLWKKRATS